MKKKIHILVNVLFCIILAFPTSLPLHNNNIQAATKYVTTASNYSVQGIVKASSLNVRTKASRTGALLKVSGKKVGLNKNTKVTITKEVISNNEKWYYISFELGKTTKKGYVLSDYVKLTSTKVLASINSKSSVMIRTGAGSKKVYLKSGSKIVSLGSGTDITIISEVTVSGEKWYKVSFVYSKKTRTGYLKAIDVLFKSKKAVAKVPVKNGIKASSQTATKYVTTASKYSVKANVNATSLNVRTKASATSAQLKVSKKNVSLKNKASVTILKEVIVSKNKWYYISFKWGTTTKKGYVLSNYVKLPKSPKVPAAVNSKTAIKIRTGAGDKKANLKVGNKIVSLSSGSNLTIVGEITTSGAKWYKVTFIYSGKTKTGYIKALDVIFKDKKVAETPPEEENTKPIETPEDTIPSNNIGNLKYGNVIGTNELRVRTGYGTSFTQLLDSNNNKVYLNLNQKVTIESESIVGSTIWYQVKFEYNGNSLNGYISGYYVKLDENGSNQVPSVPTTPETPGTSIPPIPDDNDTSNNPSVPILNDAEFEASIVNQGFPESYKPYLRTLHAQYPHWRFEAFQTGLDWNSVILNESSIGKNLITNSKNLAWKSLEAGAYNWKTDKFIPYDGSSWVTASKQAIEFYMDPRNFINPAGIFQFECLSYQPSYQTKDGVEKILLNTALFNTTYSYIDDLTQTEVTTNYGETFIKAAQLSKVSPYHLATRVKQEVVTGKTTLSSSATGTVSGYEGYYNFFNIGAYHSTEAGGSVANGLKYAKNGTTNPTINALYMIPWNSPFKSIVGGSNFIGSSYINRGQNTIYLQKFNVTPISTYSHQYMANVEATKAEASKTFAAYSSMSNVPIVFQIPVYLNMPAQASPEPTPALNPNNWLSSISVDGFELTPTFNVEDLIGTGYNLIVPGNIEGINVSASAVSTKATVSGTGYMPLAFGNNQVTITVTAENQSIRQYTINIVRDMNVVQ